jgi:hypothetical protein
VFSVLIKTKYQVMKVTGIVLIIIGVALTLFTTFKFFTKEKVVDIGVVEITRNKPNTLSWSPIIGLVVMGIGGIVLWQASKK